MNFFIYLLGFTAPLYFLKISGASLYLFDVAIIFSCLGIFLTDIQIGRAKIGLHKDVVLSFILFCLSAFISLFLFSLGDLAVPDYKSFFETLVRYSFFWLTSAYIANRLFRSIDDLNRYLIVLACSFLIPLFVNLYAVITGNESFFAAGRAASFYGNPNWFGGVVLVSSPIYLWLMLTPNNKLILRILGFTGFLLSIFGAFVSGSNSTVLTFSLILFLYICVNMYLAKRLVILLLTLPVLLICLVGFFSLIDLESEMFDLRGVKRILTLWEYIFGGNEFITSNIGSADLRLELVVQAISLIFERAGGLLGHGLAQTPIVFDALGGHSAAVHLNIVNLWIELGVIGLGAYIYLLVFLFRNCMALLGRNIELGCLSLFILLSFILYGIGTPHAYMGFLYAPLIIAFKNHN